MHICAYMCIYVHICIYKYAYIYIYIYLYDHPAGDKEVGGGERRPEEGSHHEEKNNAENTTSNRFEIKSVNGFKCFCSCNLCHSNWSSKCMGMCVHVHVCAHGDFVLPLLLSRCPPLMPSLLLPSCSSLVLPLVLPLVPPAGACRWCRRADASSQVAT